MADAEIHNRAELLNALSAAEISSSSTDADLILAAYAKWGERCPEFLAGEFSFAIWDESRRRLFCARDHIGIRPFFYWISGARLAFSNDVPLLFSVPDVVHRLNRTKLGVFSAAHLRDDGHPDETFFKGIFTVLPAGTLTFANGCVSKGRYWTPEENRVRIPAREDEAFEALRELLFEAVSCRLRGRSRAAVMLSGGLDSSALTAVAARCLEKSNRSLPLIAVAAVLPEIAKPRFTDEREFIDEFRNYPNVIVRYVAPEDAGPFDRIDDPARFAAGPLTPSTQYLTDALNDAAASEGAEAVFCGAGGEASATTAGRDYYMELALGLRWGPLARELFRFRSVYRRSPVRLLSRVAKDYLYPERSDRHQPLFLIAPDFLRQIGDIPAREWHWPHPRQTQRETIQGIQNAFAFPGQDAVPETFPFLDRRVLEFCFAAPGNLKVRNGYQRSLIRESLAGILPEKIRWRVTKRPFSPDYPRRFRAQLGKVRDFVASIGRRDPVRQIVDVDRLWHVLHLPGTPENWETASIAVPQSVYLICFLRHFTEFQP